MPFVIRKIEPKYLVRGHVPGTSKDWPVGAELEAVANGALTASLKQLASVLLAAEDIFAELTKELGGIAERSGNLRVRIDGLEEKLAKQDPKKVTVPESDICTFAARKEHFRTKREETSKDLFREETRPKALRELYESAASVAVRSLDSLRRDRDAISSIDMFVCTPILGKRTRERSLDIESRVPRAIEKLRRWTSAEALGDVTVSPDCTSRISVDALDDTRPVDHKLPSPEEQVQAVALKFPAEIVAVDVSGRGFHRMSMRRRSTHTGQENHQSDTVKRRSRPRRPRGKRRNTIAGTDRNEIRQAVVGEPRPDDSEASPTSVSKPAHRSASTDLLGSSTKYHSVEKKSHFMTLKAWGMSRLKLIGPVGKSNQHNQQQAFSSQQVESNDRTSQINGTNETRATRTQNASDANKENCEGETMFAEGRRGRRDTGKHQTSSYPRTRVEDQREEGTRDRGDERDPGSSSRPTSVRLRESAAERRERRKAGSRQDEPPHSSSGNWSASSESGRASIGSETTSTTHPPRSTTTASIGTSSTSLSHARRFKGRDTSASSSVTSEGTLTPDIIPDSGVPPFSDDGETSSVYSCDTEGYYTSFHVDSGLKTLREEEPTQLVQSAQPSQPQFKSNEVQSEPGSPGFENEYELFGRGSTSTTTSSAGTVCTTLLAPPPPERKSSLTVAAMVHGPKQNGGESPDSGHNTSSSPVESASSPACTARSCSEFEYSESSDLEGCERIERIRTKTTIDTSRIPSMCVITPPGSDDEHRDLHSRESREQRQPRKDSNQPGSVLMSATVGTSKMQVINGQDKNLYATVQTVVQTTVSPVPSAIEKAGAGQQTKISPLSGVLGKLRGVLPGRKHQQKSNSAQESNDIQHQMDSGDYVTIADVRNNNDKRGKCGITMSDGKPTNVTYANADLFKRDAEYVSLSELPKKPDSSLERRRQGARVTLDSDGKVVFSSDSLKRRKGAHTTFIPGPFVKEGPSSPMHSPLVHRSKITPRAVQRTSSVDLVDGDTRINVPEMQNQQRQQQQQQQKQQLQRSGKLIIRATKSPERASSPEYVRGPATVVAPSAGQRHLRCGAYVNVQGGEGKTTTGPGRTAPATRAKSVGKPMNGPGESKPRMGNHGSFGFQRRKSSVASLERKVLKPSSRQPNGSGSASRFGLYPASLKPSGNTPKLTKRLVPIEPRSPDLDSTGKENAEPNDISKETILEETPKLERKLKRSESYRMANSPITFIKKLGGVGSTESSDPSDKRIFRTASEELREDLLKERINYPETVASPEPDATPPEIDVSSNSEDSSLSKSMSPGSQSSPALKVPCSPRPRAVDLEPVRVLKYSDKDDEVW